MNARLHELYKLLGLPIPLIVVNCLPFARVEIYRPITCAPKTIPRNAKGGDAAAES